ncbi:MAG: hypothetical protein J5661_02225 [Bacteroidaceae bacterium]|nr:hypothetical protein [Bacteroidaceae bacterium]
MKISNEQIIESARRQRQKVESRMSVEPWESCRRSGGLVAAVGVAASLVSFFAGYALHANVPQPTAPLETQVVQVQHDTIMQVQTVRDTIYQTRIVTKYEKPMLAESSDDTPPEQKACSMLCDDIPYELLAAGR